MSFEYFQEVSNDYEKLLEINKECDVIIYAGEDENLKEIRAHSLILCTRSQYFRAVLSNEWANKKDGKFIFKKPNISPQVFKIIIRFIYCGKIDLTKLQGPELLNLLIAVDELNIQTLIFCIQEYLINHQYEYLRLNPIEILETVYKVYHCNTFTSLCDYFLKTICERPEILFNSDKLNKLSAPLLELLLKRNDLLLDEIEIWDNLIKWCLAQHPSIQYDVKKWNKEEIAIMEKTFRRFIPLIRFYHMSSEQFHLQVYPFKVLLPEYLTNNILSFHMESNNKNLNLDIQPRRKPKHDTIIIQPQHFAIFSSWIEKKNGSYYKVRDIPYHFKLIYRASRDGNTAKAFHTRCDNKGATIVVAKVRNSELIVGGYNPLSWDSDSRRYVTTKNSFIFSFTDRSNLQTAKVGHINEGYFVCAIYCYKHYGPTFGSGHDLFHCEGTTWKSYNEYSYPKIELPEDYKIIENYKVFDVENYEVFQVIEK
ncbi:hypothetical protein RclHR1_14160003 [Rhizophagus clarus]|uniref:BTB/POZ domain-containing protein n=1 Tax=Rhizophagus clarus TaxID=94130 RepID=A0A2Z6QBU5_9GLOM|nr:hypothetical protein RclHR1_14160003 [Rhizophagus clarus]GES84992.1 BTB/POZ domain-containing protein [Rhizophagus clarus]